MAENKLTRIPSANVKAKPLINDVEKINKIAQTINEFKLLSLIDGQALLNPSLMAKDTDLSSFISSLILAKIKILASTSIPMDKINPPMPAKVKVMGPNLNKESMMTMYTSKAMEAKIPGRR